MDPLAQSTYRADMGHDLKSFEAFYATPLGRTTSEFLNAAINKGRDVGAGEAMLSIGYVDPYWPNSQKHFRRPLVASAKPLPACKILGENGDQCHVAIDSDRLPFTDQSFDWVLIVHQLECVDDAQRLLNECHRILRPNGQLIFAVPNRSSAWARSKKTPFGINTGFSVRQLVTSVHTAKLDLERCQRLLFFPPSKSGVWVKLLRPFQAILSRLSPVGGGVFLVTARKRVFAQAGKTQPAEKLRALLEQGLTPARPVGARKSN